jgi:hypothetical protein
MQVTFTRTGGFAPMPIGCRLDTTQLDPDQAKELEMLVRTSGVMTTKNARVEGARDVHLYSIEVTDGGDPTHKVTLDHLSIPPQLKPLVEFLTKNSQSLLPE